MYVIAVCRRARHTSCHGHCRSCGQNRVTQLQWPPCVCGRVRKQVHPGMGTWRHCTFGKVTPVLVWQSSMWNTVLVPTELLFTSCHVDKQPKGCHYNYSIRVWVVMSDVDRRHCVMWTDCLQETSRPALGWHHSVMRTWLPYIQIRWGINALFLSALQGITFLFYIVL